MSRNHDITHHNVSTLKQTIKRLRAVACDLNCERMNKSNVVGFLGEVLVRQKLEMEGVSVLHKGGQCGYDLELPNGVTIDVKTARPRLLTGTDLYHWGWALKSASKGHISATHFVCVELTDDCEVRGLHVIRAQDVETFPPSAGRYSGVQHTYQTYERYPKLSPTSPWAPVVLGCKSARGDRRAKSLKHGELLKRHLVLPVARKAGDRK